jgi:hypothetical protein
MLEAGSLTEWLKRYQITLTEYHCTLSGELFELCTHYKHFRTLSELLDPTMQADGGGA